MEVTNKLNWIWKNRVVTISNIQVVILHLDFWASQYIIRLKSQRISLAVSGKGLQLFWSLFINSPINLTNYFLMTWLCHQFNLGINLSITSRLPPIKGSQMLARMILSFFYSNNANYIIVLNWIIYGSLPGFKPKSPGPKVATLPFCKTPMTEAL